MSAYYSRNHSYSRSFNAERAEESGRLPLKRLRTLDGDVNMQTATINEGAFSACRALKPGGRR